MLGADGLSVFALKKGGIAMIKRTRFVLLYAGMVAVFTFGMTALVWITTSDMLVQGTLDRFRERANNRMLAIDSMLASSIQDLDILASDPVFCAPEPSKQKMSVQLANFRDRLKIYVTLSYSTRAGLRLADTSGLGVGQPEDPQTLPGKQWSQVMAGGLTHGVSHSRLLNADVIFFTHTVHCPGDSGPRGAIIAGMHIWRLDALFPVTHASDAGLPVKIDLSDENGLLLFSNHNREGIMKPWVRPQGLGELTFSIQGMGTVDFKGSRWLLHLSVAREAILTPVRNLVTLLLAVSALATAAAAFLALRMGRAP